MLFPLPLAPFELLMQWDERPDYPMAFEIACDFSGSIERNEFEEAVRIVMKRHPLLAARVVKLDGVLHWVAAESNPNVVRWALDEVDLPLAEFQKTMQLSAEPGLRVLIHRIDDRLRIVWRFHHSCCDGIAGCIVIGDALAIYHGLCRGTDWQQSLRSLDEEKLRDRAVFHQARSSVQVTDAAIPPLAPRLNWKARLRGIIAPAQEAVDFLAHPPLPVATGSVKQPSVRVFPLLTVLFTAEQNERILKSSRELDVTVNDLLLACLFRTLNRWNQERHHVRPKSLLRITVPTSLRRLEDKRMPAANRMSYAFLDRRSEDCRELQPLVAGICFATRAIQRWNLSRQFVETLAFIARWPSIVRLALQSRRCFSSAVLSNLGDPSRRFEARLERDHGKVVAGKLTLESMYAVPPVRAKTRLAIAICSYAGGLSIAAVVDPATHCPDDGQELMKRLADELLMVSHNQ